MGVGERERVCVYETVWGGGGGGRESVCVCVCSQYLVSIISQTKVFRLNNPSVSLRQPQ